MGAVAVLLCGVALVGPTRDEGAPEPRGQRPSSPVALDAAKEEGVVAPAVGREPLAVAPIPEAVSGEALAAALGEERVVLASSTAVIERIEMDRPWVCAGGQVSLAARVGGTLEPGALFRWVWPGQETGAELHPGVHLPWRAPATPGTAFVRFQVCKDLGGRRVGVLAEQVLRIEVRDCADAASREALEVAVIQRTNEAFLFRAISSEAEALTGYYSWDFGDGRSTVSPGPEVEHVYDAKTPDERTFTVRLTAGKRTGAPLSAMAFVRVRGQPPSDMRLPATLTLSRTSSSAETWRSEVTVEVPEESTITWERVERMTLHWDDQVEVMTLDWRDAITVREERGRGAFQGSVEVRPGELAVTVKQVVDILHGRDATGTEVSLSWASFKRESAPSGEARPPLK